VYHGRVSHHRCAFRYWLQRARQAAQRPRVRLGSDTGPPKLVSYARTAAHGDGANATELEGKLKAERKNKCGRSQTNSYNRRHHSAVEHRCEEHLSTACSGS
jgi:hypothetical protein